MKRGKPANNPDAILCADLHLRLDTPTCRTDNLGEETLWIKLGFIKRLQEEYDCDVYHAGDLFNHWKPSPLLVSKTIQYLPKKFYTVYGQHDLPQHNLKLAYKCGIDTLERALVLEILEDCHWKETPKNASRIHHAGTNFRREVLVWHKMTYIGKKPFPESTAPNALAILKKYPRFNLIVTGDNHKPFVQEHEGRLLVNPGSMYRSTADQINHKPRVYLWYARTNEVKAIFIPIEKDAVSREHIEEAEERSGRIDAFISRLSTDWEATTDFKGSLQKFEQENSISDAVMGIIYKAISNE